MQAARRRAAHTLLLAGCAGALALSPGPRAVAQVPPLVGSTTTTTTPPTTTEGPEPAAPAAPAQAPPGAHDPGGDGALPPEAGIVVPPEAQRIIDSVRRSGPRDTSALFASLEPLRALGLSDDEVLREGLGRFPVAGPARYSHDWLYPRYGPGFRFHLGTDVFAAFGTSVRTPVDGVAQHAEGGLGGLTVKVFMADGTFFYLAHLSGLAPGFTDGMSVRTGDIVGYVGDSGNARGGAPHLHLGIYPRGGPAIDPKPVLDRFLAEALARIPSLIDAHRRAAPATSVVTRTLPRSMLATTLVHELAAAG